MFSLCCSSDSYVKSSKKSLIGEFDSLFEELFGFLLPPDLLIRLVFLHFVLLEMRFSALDSRGSFSVDLMNLYDFFGNLGCKRFGNE